MTATKKKTKALKYFWTGVTVHLGCYKKGCESVSILARLGQDETAQLHPSFLGAGEINWIPGTPVKAFAMKERVTCPICKTRFTTIIIVSRGKGHRPTIFGYDPEPD